jgi:hypothetical protein
MHQIRYLWTIRGILSQALATVVQEPRRHIDGAGKTYVTERRRNLQVDFELRYIDQGWSATSIDSMK